MEDPRDYRSYRHEPVLRQLEGVRVLGIGDEAVIPEVHIELERQVVGSPTFGVVARVQGRSAVRLLDLSMAARKIAIVWNK